MMLTLRLAAQEAKLLGGSGHMFHGCLDSPFGLLHWGTRQLCEAAMFGRDNSIGA